MLKRNDLKSKELHDQRDINMYAAIHKTYTSEVQVWWGFPILLIIMCKYFPEVIKLNPHAWEPPADWLEGFFYHLLNQWDKMYGKLLSWEANIFKALW